MAQFPVEYNRSVTDNLIEAVNYALSGPGSLGQDFSGFASSYPAWLAGSLRAPQTLAGYHTPAHGASTSTDITVSSPGSVRQLDPDVPSRIAAGQYVYGTGIATGAQVDASYDPIDSPWSVPLTIANVGAVQNVVSFYPSLPFSLYIAPLAISTIEYIDTDTIQVNFAVDQAEPPFALGSNPIIAGSTAYNGIRTQPGVVACTTSSVTLQTQIAQADLGTATGGTISVSNTIQPPVIGVDPGFPNNIYFNATDARGLSTVNGNNARVLIASQIDNTLSYTCTVAAVIEYTVLVNRFKGIPQIDVQVADFQYYYDDTIASQSYQYTVPVGTATLPVEKTVFTNIIDLPENAYYLYKLDLVFRVINDGGAAEITASKLGNRSISCQVVKE